MTATPNGMLGFAFLITVLLLLWLAWVAWTAGLALGRRRGLCEAAALAIEVRREFLTASCARDDGILRRDKLERAEGARAVADRIDGLPDRVFEWVPQLKAAG